MSDKAEAAFHPLKTPQEILDWARDQRQMFEEMANLLRSGSTYQAAHLAESKADAFTGIIDFITGEEND